jgi:VWFA-related protein
VSQNNGRDSDSVFSTAFSGSLTTFYCALPQALRSERELSTAMIVLLSWVRHNKRCAAGTALVLAVGIPALFAQHNNARMPLDVVVEDSSGNPVPDLEPDDFTILEDGRLRPITGLEYIGEGVLERRAPPSLTFSAPGEPLRSIVILIDDSGMSEVSMQELRAALGAIELNARSGDAVAIVTASGNFVELPKLFTSKPAIHAAAAHIAFSTVHRPGVLDAGFCGRGDTAPSVLGTLSVIRRTVDGLRDLPGRKSIMFVSEGFAPGTGEVAARWKELLPYVNRAAVAISTLDPRGIVPPFGSDTDCARLRAAELTASRRALAELAAATSGISIADQDDRAAISRLMKEGSGYYLLGYQPNVAPDPSRSHAVSIRVSRPGVIVRCHAGLSEIGAGDLGAHLSVAVNSPFALPGIRAAVSSRFWDDVGSVLQSEVWIDARDLAFSVESGGSTQVKFDLMAVTLDDSGRSVDSFSQSYTVDIPVAFRQTILGDGLTQRLRLPVKKPGGYQVRVAVRDQRSDRIGSAAAFVDVPDLTRGDLALSGILIGKTGERGAAAAASPRRFHPGQTVTVGYQILNARRDATGNARVDVTTALMRAGNILATGNPSAVDGKDQPDPARLLRVREFQFGEDLEPGVYSLKVTAVDRNGPQGSDPISQSIDFEIN